MTFFVGLEYCGFNLFKISEPVKKICEKLYLFRIYAFISVSTLRPNFLRIANVTNRRQTRMRWFPTIQHRANYQVSFTENYAYGATQIMIHKNREVASKTKQNKTKQKY